METGLWSSEGRIPRKTFWLRWLGCLAANLIIGVVVGIFGIASGMSESAMDGMARLVSLPITVFGLIQGAKRMHDVGKSGWYQIIPIYNLVLACTPGDSGWNKYGADPLEPSVVDHVETFR